MIISSVDQGTQDIFNRRPSRAARRTCPQAIWRVAQRKLDQLNAAVSLRSLGVPPGNRLEALKAIESTNTAFGSTTSSACISSGQIPGRSRSRSLTTIDPDYLSPPPTGRNEVKDPWFASPHMARRLTLARC